jgi:hypothetical protein
MIHAHREIKNSIVHITSGSTYRHLQKKNDRYITRRWRLKFPHLSQELQATIELTGPPSN